MQPPETVALNSTAIAAAVRERRGARTLREASVEAGISHSALMHAERGSLPRTTDNFLSLLRWIGWDDRPITDLLVSVN